MNRPKLTLAGEQALEGKNFVSHTRVYINGALQIDTSTGSINAPVLGYQINRSRKLGAAKLVLNVANPDGRYSYKKQADPIFGYGNKIRIQEGLTANGSIEWFTRFTGIIVSQVASNIGGKPSLRVYAMDNMKLLMDFVPDDLYYRPTAIKRTGEVLTAVANGGFQHYRGNQNNLPWVDIPYPVFYKNGVKIKENYEIDLINGEVYFGEKMWEPQWIDATKVTDQKYTVAALLKTNTLVRRSFKLVKYSSNGSNYEEQVFAHSELPKDVGVSLAGYELNFTKDPFYDLISGDNWHYIDKKITVTTEAANQVTSDYWYYDGNSNLAKEVIKDLALRAGFKPEQIILEQGIFDISLKPMHFTNLTVKNGFEILQKIKQQLSPNYILTCDTEGNLVGYVGKAMVTGEYNLDLVKKIDAPVSEEGLYSVVVAHGVDLNPDDLGKAATAVRLATADSVLSITGDPSCIFNKNTDDQITWNWVKKNDETPPTFPIDLLQITLKEAKKLEEINILVGDFKGGTIQQSLSVQVSENGSDWFYVDRSSRGVHGASSQWVTVKGGELDNRKIIGIKICIEDAFSWVETHTYSRRSGFLNLSVKVNTDNYYHWFAAIKEIQILEENTIPVTTSLGNCIGIGNGVSKEFYIPNTPLVSAPDTPIIYVEGRKTDPAEYTVNTAIGKVTFVTAPTGLVTADYRINSKKAQPLTQASITQRYGNNIAVKNTYDPLYNIEFTGGNITVNSPEYKLLKKIGLKKITLRPDNYLNSYNDAKKRGQEMLQEISRLEDTLEVEVIYRPDIDICQTVDIVDNVLGISAPYFIEEITESKQGYKPSLKIKVSNYSL